MRRVLICLVVFFVASAVMRAAFHGVFDVLGIDYEPTGGSRSDPKNPPGEFIAAIGSLAVAALAAAIVYRRLGPSAGASGPSVSGSPAVLATSSRGTTAPANWYPDPSGQHELRYWDGREWTAHVSTGGVQAVSADPELDGQH